MRRNYRVAAFAAVVLLLGGFALWWWSVDSYEAPPQTREAAPPARAVSTLVLPLDVSLDELQRRANEAAPQVVYAIDEGRNACVPGQWIDKCLVSAFGRCRLKIKTRLTPDIDCHLNGNVSRGPIVVDGAGNALRVSAPLHARITARGRGDIGRHVQTTGTGSVDVVATVSAGIDANWRPQANLNVDYSWANRFGVDILGFRITFASKVDPAIREQIAGFTSRLPAYLETLQVRNRAEQGWQRAFFSRQVSSAPPISLRFTPEAIGYGGYTIQGRTLRSSILVRGAIETFLGSSPPAAAPTPLPALTTDMPPAGFNVALPISMPFPALIGEAKKALKIGEAFKVTLGAAGEVSARFSDVQIYQTTDRRLAIGLSVEADAANDQFDAKGMIWFIASARADNNARRIVVDHLEVYSKTDNMPLDLLVSLVQVDVINARIRKAFEFDYSKKYEELIGLANSHMPYQISEGVRIEGKLDEASVSRTYIDSEGITAILEARGSARLVVRP
ncbi:MAG: DUF4403 family protein [Phreatobacter sp.]|jgi:hypothetical protein|uniref:DUF4403 family protein n=1 Tax=Phreatobacter sp. TaxID=1966341 RepID=UPI0040358E21